MVMVQTGQAARRIKKETDAKPKVGAKKLIKDAALNAIMFAGPGKFIKGAKVIEAGIAAKKAQASSKTFNVVRRNIRKSASASKPKVTTSEAKAIAKEAGRRPIAPRPRNVPKGSTNSLTASEKKNLTQVGTVTRPKPKPKMSQQDIAVKKATERKAKFTKLLTPVKPVGTTKVKPSQRPQLPKHKTDVKIYKISKRTPSEKEQLAEKLKNAAQNPKNTFAARPKSDISKGRGNTPQPDSITKTADPAITRGERVERIQQIKASRGGTKFTKKTKSGQTVSVSKIDSPRNAASNRMIMKERVKEGEEEAAKVSKKLNAGTDRRIKKNAAKVDATLAKAKQARQGKSLQNTFNKPIFQRKPSTGKLTVKRPIKPTKE
jgi:hypothetical protein